MMRKGSLLRELPILVILALLVSLLIKTFLVQFFFIPSGSMENTLQIKDRVAVNRLWQIAFGTGIVRTSENFGVQGEWPSHPELLDWLATEYVRSGWNTKAML